MNTTDHLFTRDPWPHQRLGVEQTIHALSNGTDLLCLTSPTGSGKTEMLVALSRWGREKSWRVLLFTNRILLTEQTHKVFRAAGEEVGVISASMPHYEYEGVPITIATMQTVLSRRRKEGSYWVDADLVLADECFPAGTLIDGQAIETLQVGDTVQSYNHATGTIEPKPITATMTRFSLDKHCRLVLSCATEVRCTSTHPVYSLDADEYVRAQDLKDGERVYASHLHMPGMRGRVHREEEKAGGKAGVLLRSVCRATSRSATEGDAIHVLGLREDILERNVQKKGGSAGLLQQMHGVITEQGGHGPQCGTLLQANEGCQPNAQTRSEGEGVGCTQAERTQAHCPGGQWSGNDETGAVHCQDAQLAPYHCQNAGMEGRCKDAEPLQDRCRQSHAQNCHRNRREFPRPAGTASPGPEKGSFPSVARVVSVEVYQPTSGAAAGGMSQGHRVYNLEVEGNNNYFANGLLVHNCHQCSSGESAALLNEYKQRGAKVVGVTATPLGVSNVCDELIVAARTRDLQDQGILCYAYWFAPSELDTRKLVKGKVDLSLTENDARKTWGPLRGDNAIRTRIVGNILEHYERLHPEKTHTLAFAPGVKESLWAAQFCRSRGIRALHVDGEDFWVDGKLYDRKQDEQQFQEARQAWRDGEIPILWNRFCLDEETEILTSDGWVGKNDISYEHEVANWDNRRVYFEEPLEVIERDRYPDEQMVALETPRISLRVTADHDLLYRTTEDGRFLKAKAKDRVGRVMGLPVSGVAAPLPMEIEQPDMLNNLERRISSNAWELRRRGHDADTSWVEAERRLRERAARLRYKQPRELTLEECEFIGFWLGDGNRNNLQSGGVEYRLYQAVKCTEIVKRIDELCDLMEVDRIKRHRLVQTNKGETDLVTWSLPRGTGFGPQQRRGLFHLEPYLEKDGSPLYWGLDNKQFDALLAGLWMADGQRHLNTAGLPATQLRIVGERRALFDLLQSIAVCRGYRASIRSYKQSDPRYKPLIHLSLTKADEHRMTKYRLAFEEGWKPERVWCVRTSSGNIITRRRGSVCVMGNCFREGIDEPQIKCIILATPIGSYRSFLQMVGRGLRTHPDKDKVLIIDHGGCWWKFGSVNVNVDWESVFDCQDPETISKNRIAEQREKGEPMGQVCPKCGMVHKAFSRLIICQYCGHELARGKPSRPILQADGTLTQVSGEPVKQWKIKSTPTSEKDWNALYWNAVKNKGGDVTFNQLYGQAFYRTAVLAGTKDRPAFWKAHYLPRNLPLMPTRRNDWHRTIAEVPRDNLY